MVLVQMVSQVKTVVSLVIQMLSLVTELKRIQAHKISLIRALTIHTLIILMTLLKPATGSLNRVLRMAMLLTRHTMQKTVMESAIIQMFRIHLKMLVVRLIHTVTQKLATGLIVLKLTAVQAVVSLETLVLPVMVSQATLTLLVVEKCQVLITELLVGLVKILLNKHRPVMTALTLILRSTLESGMHLVSRICQYGQA